MIFSNICNITHKTNKICRILMHSSRHYKLHQYTFTKCYLPCTTTDIL
ncbi:hypothetical protein AAJ76_1100082137 [Vairimorpha ceranae]|uniref:Uncharacterized protein n=1 Tax=Vairimorpha ceranae TaxID=40302 RepID=A0A0F9ZEF9_9MICR|nr:hypothetical protein AAJ76_1100082137 [Vairimorpha ceranae]KKO75849.1 hypothetical protein AAJ76_1100082137 [Vairimorpha ceranae]